MSPGLLVSLVLTARAEPRLVQTYALGSSITDAAFDPDGGGFAFVEAGSDALWIVDEDTWGELSVAPCADDSLVDLAISDRGPAVICAGGGIRVYDWNGAPLITDLSLTAGGSVVGMAAEEGLLYPLSLGAEGDTLELHKVDLDTLTADEDGDFPCELTGDGVEDIEVIGDYVVLTRGGSIVARSPISTCALGQATAGISGADMTDVADVGSNSIALLAGGAAGVLQYIVTTNNVEVQLSSGVGTVTALGPWGEELLVADGEGISAFALSDAGLPSGSSLYTLDLPTAGVSVEELGAYGGYALAAGRNGEVGVYTERPWVEVSLANPGSKTTGDAVRFSFESDLAGEYTIRYGGETNTDGVPVRTGTVAAGEEVDQSVTVDESWPEGRAEVRVVVTTEDGLVGHGGVAVTVDNPPDAPAISDANVAFGDGLLTLSFDELEDTDIAAYYVYVTTSPFSADAWEDCDSSAMRKCGPEFDGDDELTTPIKVEPGETDTLAVEISPLTNQQTYYIALRAVDDGGQESPMSNVVTGTPQETYIASQLAGEEGGFCGSPLPASAALAGLGALLVGLRRRAGLAALAALMVPGLALAKKPPPDPGVSPEAAASHGVAQFRYGPLTLEDESIGSVYDSSGFQVLWLEGGPHLIKQIEVTGGIGRVKEFGSQVSEGGIASENPVIMRFIPVTANATLRADFLYEQILVPAGSVGVDYWVFREGPPVGDTSNETVVGGMPGWHYALSGQLRLDNLEPDRASLLRASRGIDNSYLVVEWRRQMVDRDAEGFVLNADTVGIGIKLDY